MLWSLWLMSPWRAYLLLLQDHAWRTGTYGEMISSNLHRAKSPLNGCWDPSQGQTYTRGLHRRKRRMFHYRQLGRPGPMDLFPFHHDVGPWMPLKSSFRALTSPSWGIQLEVSFGWHVWQFLRGFEPQRFTLEAKHSKREANVTLGGAWHHPKKWIQGFIYQFYVILDFPCKLAMSTFFDLKCN